MQMKLIIKEFKDKKSLSFAEILFLLGVFTKQFYLLPSGSFQIGDALFMLSFSFLFLEKDACKLKIKNEDVFFLFFVICVCCINTIYSLILRKSLMKCCLYYIYVLIIIYTFNVFISNSYFVFLLKRTLFICLCTQLLIYIVGVGGWEGGRYKGTFNDPNQYGFYVLSSFFMYCLSSTGKERNILACYGICFILTIFSASTGMMLGLLIFTFFWLLYIKEVKRNRMILLSIIFCAFVIVIVCYLYIPVVLPPFIEESFMFRRILQKFQKMGVGNSNGSIYKIFVERGWNRVVENPEYLLYGAGEGNYIRFGSTHEIHSSILGPLFYYGILPCSLIIIWISKKLYNIDGKLKSIYIALLIESLTLANYRQPFFWMIFVLAGLSNNKQNYMEKSDPI